jgi:hypothetical protein
MSPREQRIIHNEDLFREVNAHIANLEDRIRTDDDLLPLICECANTGCTTLIEVEPARLRAVRKNPLRFLVAPGHQGEGEKVVHRETGYLIVEKPATGQPDTG